MRPVLLALLLLIPAQIARAQEPEPTAEAADAPIHVDPVTGRRYRRVRPDEPLRRGPLAVEAWVPLALGGAGAIFAGVVLVLAHRRRRRER